MIFIVSKTSGRSQRHPPVKDDAVFRLWHDGRYYWAIKLDTLDEMIGFMDRHGEDIIISQKPVIEYNGLICREIEIYDDYRE